jgi:NAD(P)-dependent dehydrogenase (short-subunit alcohol dehydrogenase family)
MPHWTAADLPPMTGRTVVITGAGTGIGLISARELARAGARVVVAVRNEAKARDAIRGMPGLIEVRRLDVSDLSSVRAFADDWDGPLDVLVNNAGVMDIPAQRTADGFDLQTATNYLGPFALSNLLLKHVTGRVVSVTSQLHRRARLDLADLDWRSRPYRPMRAYGESKLEVVLFSLELQRRLDAAGSPVRSVLAHPGIATTALAAHSPSGRVNSLRFLLNDPEHGALPTLFAVSQDVPGNAYIGPDGPGSIRGYPVIRKPGRAGLDADAARRLWDATARLTGAGAWLSLAGGRCSTRSTGSPEGAGRGQYAASRARSSAVNAAGLRAAASQSTVTTLASAAVTPAGTRTVSRVVRLVVPTFSTSIRTRSRRSS